MKRDIWSLACIGVICVLALSAALGAVIGAAEAESKPRPTPMPPVPPWESSHDRGLPWGTVQGMKVNFRTGPGTEYESLFQLSTGCAVEVVGEYNGWYQVIRAGVAQPVWVCGEYLEIVEE